MHGFDHILFDLGGVLVDFRGVSSLADRLGRPHGETAETWLASPVVRAYERGHIDSRVFMEQIREELSLELDTAQLADEMAGWLPGLLPGAQELVGDLAEQNVAVSCLSNTNDLHWQRMRSWGVDDWFRHHVLSHEVGLVKPDAEIFEHACRVLECAPDRILFLDDHPKNVAAAADHGLHAVQVEGPTAARAALHRAGILSS